MRKHTKHSIPKPCRRPWVVELQSPSSIQGINSNIPSLHPLTRDGSQMATTCRDFMVPCMTLRSLNLGSFRLSAGGCTSSKVAICVAVSFRPAALKPSFPYITFGWSDWSGSFQANLLAEVPLVPRRAGLLRSRYAVLSPLELGHGGSSRWDGRPKAAVL